MRLLGCVPDLTLVLSRRSRDFSTVVHCLRWICAHAVEEDLDAAQFDRVYKTVLAILCKVSRTWSFLRAPLRARPREQLRRGIDFSSVAVRRWLLVLLWRVFSVRVPHPGAVCHPGLFVGGCGCGSGAGSNCNLLKRLASCFVVLYPARCRWRRRDGNNSRSSP